MKKNKILIVEDEALIAEEIKNILFENDYDICEIISSGELAIKKAELYKPDLVLMDIHLEGELNGIDSAKQIYKEHKVPVLFVSSYADDSTILNVLSTNPFGFIIKPINENELLINIKIAILKHREETKIQDQYEDVLEKYKQKSNSYFLVSKQLENLIQNTVVGISRKTEHFMKQAMTAAKYHNTNVLITGESGTGKEIVARIIHYASDRKDKDFVIVNSCAIPSTLLESEFFGHKKGAFTGAIADKKGYLELADNGTLFLDEIADMPIDLQAKLLRVIEEKKVSKLGEYNNIDVNFRIISATNKDIHRFVENNQFRLDLLFRLNTMIIHIPPLRERKEDIVPLLKYYIHKISTDLKKPTPEISEEALDVLNNYHFPGNIRELKNLVENALIHSNKDKLEISDFLLCSITLNDAPPFSKLQEDEDMNLTNIEIRIIKKALEMTNFNQTKAAKLIGISRDSFIRRLAKHNIVIRKY